MAHTSGNGEPSGCTSWRAGIASVLSEIFWFGSFASLPANEDQHASVGIQGVAQAHRQE